MPKGFVAPDWCDGTVQACLRCGLNDQCNLPITPGEAEALRIASSVDGVIDTKEVRKIGNMPPEERKRRNNSMNKTRYANDPAYREYHRQYGIEWRKRRKEARKRAEEAKRNGEKKAKAT